MGKRIKEAYGYGADDRSFNQRYTGLDTDSLFEGYDVPEKFKKLFEAERRKTKVLSKRLSESMDLIGGSANPAKMAEWKAKAKKSMIYSIGPNNYAKLFESKRLREFDEWDEDEELENYSDEYFEDDDEYDFEDEFDEEPIDHDFEYEDDNSDLEDETYMDEFFTEEEDLGDDEDIIDIEYGNSDFDLDQYDESIKPRKRRNKLS